LTPSIALAALVFVGIASLGAAAYVYLLERSRRGIVDRTSAPTPTMPYGRLFGSGAQTARQSLARILVEFVPASWTNNTKTETALVQAGYDSATAPLTYAAVRVALLISMPMMVLMFAPKPTFTRVVTYVACAAIIAALLPVWYLVRAVRVRQETIRRSLPDTLDLLVVCIEAGISLDAAILRVARELASVHPQLAAELVIVNRKTNAGMSREDALRGLWTRTGVHEIRTLVSHIVQGEKWGTSSGRVLRVYAETLRRLRRQAAEKKAATLPVKMLLPLGLFIFPSIFIVILGPVGMSVMKLFAK
jgi:tight adherence protein C